MINRILFLLLFPFTSWAATYYVSQSGGGSHDGSSNSNAWSLSEFNSKTSLAGGDTVNFGDISGTVTPKSSGSASANIKLTGGNGGTFDFGGGTPIHDIEISNWKYTGASNGTATWCSANYGYNITISNCTIDNVKGMIYGDSTQNHDIFITGCYARSSTNTTEQTDIIKFGDARNITIEKCKLINRAPGDPNIRHNDVIQNYQKGGSNSGQPTNWILRYNWIENQQTSGSGDASWLMLQSMTGDPAIKIYGNVFCGTGSAGNNGMCISRNGGGKYYLYGNTVIRHNKPDNTIRYLDSGTAIWKNNVGMADSGVSGTFTAITMTNGGTDYNFWYRFGSSFAGSHGSTSRDPLFTNYSSNDFSTQASSPLRGAADKTIGDEYSYGIAPGSTWPNPTVVKRTNWDVGAFEAGGAPPSPTPTPTPVPPKFVAGDYVTPTALVNVRATPAGAILGTHDVGDVGIVKSGPVTADINNQPEQWYEITWSDDPMDGFVGDNNLEKTATPSPTVTPVPSPSASPTPTPGVTYDKWIQKQNDWTKANPPTPD